MKARRVKRLDPDASLAAGVARVAAVRVGELESFMPSAADPAEVKALHDMRIAAKRVRYLLELASPALGPPAAEGARIAKGLQALLGDIHDIDELLPLVRDAGLEAAEVELSAQRAALFARFLKRWQQLVADGFADGLREALSATVPEPRGPTGGAAP